jgi:hypothetical protein
MQAFVDSISQFNSPSSSINIQKQNKFKQTVLEIQNIVQNKIYKETTNSIESYFKRTWHISRAQVYRYLDCALVFKVLKDFDVQPGRERLCRSLKKTAKTEEDMWYAFTVYQINSFKYIMEMRAGKRSKRFRTNLINDN